MRTNPNPSANNERAREIKAEIEELKQQIADKEKELKETGYNENHTTTWYGVSYVRPKPRS